MVKLFFENDNTTSLFSFNKNIISDEHNCSTYYTMS